MNEADAATVLRDAADTDAAAAAAAADAADNDAAGAGGGGAAASMAARVGGREKPPHWVCTDLYVGKLHLVDLAGIDRLGMTDASGETLKEARFINSSLNSLGTLFIHMLWLHLHHLNVAPLHGLCN